MSNTIYLDHYSFYDGINTWLLVTESVSNRSTVRCQALRSSCLPSIEQSLSYYIARDKCTPIGTYAHIEPESQSTRLDHIITAACIFDGIR